MDAPLDVINRRTYDAGAIVASYAGDLQLQAPEISILLGYRDAYWGKTVLDIGCGAGRTTHFLRQYVGDYVGIDYSQGMVDACRRRFPSERIEVADARDLSRFGEGEFDFVLFSFNGLDYMGEPDRQTALKQIHRVLIPGGVFVFSTHNLDRTDLRLEPRFQMARNPCQIVKNLHSYVVRRVNRRRNRRHEQRRDGFAILNDNAHDYTLLTYYVTRDRQLEQLAEHGFEYERSYDARGLALDGADPESSWVYYVARRR